MQSRRTVAKQVKDYLNPKKNNKFSPSPIKRYASSKSFHHYSQTGQSIEAINKENQSLNTILRNKNQSSAPSFTQTRGRGKPLQQLFTELEPSPSIESSHNSDDYEKVDINRKVSDLLKRERKDNTQSNNPNSSKCNNDSNKTQSLNQKALASEGKNSKSKNQLKAQAIQADKPEGLNEKAQIQVVVEDPEVSLLKTTQEQNLKQSLMDKLQNSQYLPSLQINNPQIYTQNHDNQLQSTQIMNQALDDVEMSECEEKEDIPSLRIESSWKKENYEIVQPIKQLFNKNIDESLALNQGQLDQGYEQQAQFEFGSDQFSSNDASYQSSNSKDIQQFNNQNQEDQKVDMSPISQDSKIPVQLETPREIISLDGQMPANINLTQNTVIMPHPSNPNAMQYSGRWTDEEHEKFLEGLKIYGKDWRLIEEYIGSRTCAQIRSHAQKYFNKLNRNQTKRAQKLLMAEKQTLGKRVHHPDFRVQQSASQIMQTPAQKQNINDLSPDPSNLIASQFVLEKQLSTQEIIQPVIQPKEIVSHTQNDISQAPQMPENILNVQSIQEQTREQISKIQQNLSKINDQELQLQLSTLITQREKVSLDFMLKKISSVEACKSLIQITNQFHEQAMNALRNSKFEMSNRMVDERNLTQFICILLSKQVQIMPPNDSSVTHPENEIIQHVTTSLSNSQVSMIGDEIIAPKTQHNTVQKRPRLSLKKMSGPGDYMYAQQTPDMSHLRGLQQPNFNLQTRGIGSITPFRSLIKTPNPIQRLLPDDCKFSGIKSDLLAKTNLANSLGLNMASLQSAHKEVQGALKSKSQ